MTYIKLGSNTEFKNLNMNFSRTIIPKYILNSVKYIRTNYIPPLLNASINNYSIGYINIKNICI